MIRLDFGVVDGSKVSVRTVASNSPKQSLLYSIALADTMFLQIFNVGESYDQDGVVMVMEHNSADVCHASILRRRSDVLAYLYCYTAHGCCPNGFPKCVRFTN